MPSNTMAEALQSLGLETATPDMAVYVAVSFLPDGGVGFFPVAKGPDPDFAPEAARAVAAGALVEQALLYQGAPIDYLRVYAVNVAQAMEMVDNPAWFVLRMMEDECLSSQHSGRQVSRVTSRKPDSVIGR